MGKQWLLYKFSGDNGCQATTKKSNGKLRKKDGGDKQIASSSSSGCMNAIFHLFDMQHYHFPFSSSIHIPHQEHNIILKGVEAPRNSLELEEHDKQQMVEEEITSSSSSSSSKPKKDTNYNIPMGGIQIKTKRSRLMDNVNFNDVSSECSSSSPAGTKTPTLVARLMGLDLLPENSSPRASLSSPRPSSSSSHATPLNPLSKLSSHKNSTRSLPVTPRSSTSAINVRPSIEVDYHHRFSLQVSKENKRRYDHESKSEYAKQLVQQMKENISRRVGADITNNVKKKEYRRDDCLVVLKPKRPLQLSSAANDKSRNLDQGHGGGKENEPVPLSASPRHRLLEIKNKLNKPVSNSPKCSPLSSSNEVTTKPQLSSTTKLAPLIKNENPMKVQKCKKLASEKYDLRLKKMHQQQEEQFMKKCNNNKKSTPLSKHLVSVNTTTKFISFKKDMASSSSTALPQKQVTYESIQQLPSCQSRAYNTNGTSNSSGGLFFDHFEYISRILNRTGISQNTPISITHWYSPSHPLHPSIFDDVEKLFHVSVNVAASSNRKLIFDVTDELLVEILKPYLSFKPWVELGHESSRKMNGVELTRKLCEKIRCFPATDCRVLEDIDGLIEGDMSRMTRDVGTTAFEEEAEELVAELERDVIDTLVNEVAGIIWHVGCVGKV